MPLPDMQLPERREALLLVAAALLAGRANAGTDSARWLPWPVGRAVPPLRLPDLEGRDWDLVAEQGRPVLLNFWATWCEPCRAEMKSFEVLEQRFAASRLKVVAVNYKEGREPVRRFRESQALSLAVVRDSYGDAAQAWGVHTFPTTFVINPVGRPLLQVEGEVDWASPAAHQRLLSIL